VRFLLDTHILLWWVSGSRRLSKSLRRAIESPDHDVAVSAASFWEIAIKRQLGRISIDLAGLLDAVQADGFEEIPVRAAHALRLQSLPDHHRDPFDCLLIAQSIVEARRLITRDEALDIALDQHGIALSSGSACKAGSPEPTHVLLAMGRTEEEAYCSVRFSLSRETTPRDIEMTLEALTRVLEEMETTVRFLPCK
jgi:Uncharacterized protein conserved in bacteria